MQIVEHVVIAVAGLGSRLGLGQPKCLVEIEGHPIIEYQLKLLEDVPNVRLVVGFEEHEVMKVARKLRPDIVFVRNPSFRTTTTLASYAMGAEHIDKPCLFMDGDIIFEPDSFRKFVDRCTNEKLLVGVTAAKTDDAVYAHIGDDKITKFSRAEESDFEWANIVLVPPGYFSCENKSVYERLEDDLPLSVCSINSYEIDTVEDFERAKSNLYRLT